MTNAIMNNYDLGDVATTASERYNEVVVALGKHGADFSDLVNDKETELYLDKAVLRMANDAYDFGDDQKNKKFSRNTIMLSMIHNKLSTGVSFGKDDNELVLMAKGSVPNESAGQLKNYLTANLAVLFQENLRADEFLEKAFKHIQLPVEQSGIEIINYTTYVQNNDVRKEYGTDSRDRINIYDLIEYRGFTDLTRNGVDIIVSDKNSHLLDLSLKTNYELIEGKFTAPILADTQINFLTLANEQVILNKGHEHDSLSKLDRDISITNINVKVTDPTDAGKVSVISVDTEYTPDNTSPGTVAGMDSSVAIDITPSFDLVKDMLDANGNVSTATAWLGSNVLRISIRIIVEGTLKGGLFTSKQMSVKGVLFDSNGVEMPLTEDCKKFIAELKFQSYKPLYNVLDDRMRETGPILDSESTRGFIGIGWKPGFIALGLLRSMTEPGTEDLTFAKQVEKTQLGVKLARAEYFREKLLKLVQKIEAQLKSGIKPANIKNTLTINNVVFPRERYYFTSEEYDVMQRINNHETKDLGTSIRTWIEELLTKKVDDMIISTLFAERLADEANATPIVKIISDAHTAKVLAPIIDTINSKTKTEVYQVTGLIDKRFRDKLIITLSADIPNEPVTAFSGLVALTSPTMVVPTIRDNNGIGKVAYIRPRYEMHNTTPIMAIMTLTNLYKAFTTKM